VAYLVTVKPSAARALKKLSADHRRRVAATIDALAGNPRPAGVEVLEARERLYRVRSGDYRILYQIHDAVLVVLVVRIGHRREIYRHV
jgi:mRNA interferase RelE/StbE